MSDACHWAPSTQTPGPIDGKPVMPRNIHTYVSVATEDEAHYFCAMFNSSVRDLIVRGYSVSKGFAAPHVLETVAIPGSTPMTFTTRRWFSPPRRYTRPRPRAKKPSLNLVALSSAPSTPRPARYGAYPPASSMRFGTRWPSSKTRLVCGSLSTVSRSSER